MLKNSTTNTTSNLTDPNQSEAVTISATGASWYSLIIFGILISLLTISANLGAVIDILRKKKHTPFQFYLINLTAVDFLTGLFAQPCFLLYNFFQGIWVLGDKLCNFWIFFDTFVNPVSYLTLVVISADRLLAVALPVFYQRTSTKTKAVLVIIGIWLLVGVPFLTNFIPLRVLAAHPELDCVYINWPFITGRGLFSTILVIYAPPVLITLNYLILIALMLHRLIKKKRKSSLVLPVMDIQNNSSIFPGSSVAGGDREKSMMQGSIAGSQRFSRVVSLTVPGNAPNHGRLSQKRVSRTFILSERDRKPMVLLCYLITFFFVTFVPISVYTFIWTADEDLPTKTPTTYDAVYWLQYLNSMINPFLYALVEKNVFGVLLTALRRCCLGEKGGLIKVVPRSAATPTPGSMISRTHY